MLSGLALAHEGHQMQNDVSIATDSAVVTDHSSMDHSKMNQLDEKSNAVDHTQHQAITTTTGEESIASHSTHDHRKEHGAQVYQRVTIDNAWMLDEDGKGTLDSSLELRIGTDENKLFIKGNSSKAESDKIEYDLSALYSRNIADFWDVQAGVRYSDNPERTTDQERIDAALGLHGLAQYFFDFDEFVKF